MNSEAIQSRNTRWLLENGPKELESLFRVIAFPSAPIRLANLDPEEHAGRDSKPAVTESGQTLLEDGERIEALAPAGLDDDTPEAAKPGRLPARNLVMLPHKGSRTGERQDRSQSPIPAWVHNYALCLLDAEGQIAAWYGGAERLYGYQSAEVIGEHISLLCGGAEARVDSAGAKLNEDLQRAADQGHFGSEGWRRRKDGSRFWANFIVMALTDDKGVLQGFASVERDFSDRHERDEKLQRSLTRVRPASAARTIAGVVSGEFDRILEASDPFLELVGYSREYLLSGQMPWRDLTPKEYVALDEFAHEEELRFGACTPFRKELFRKDGTRVPVLVTTAVLKMSPFRWITFITGPREREREESLDEEDTAEVTPFFEEIVGSSTPMKRMMGQVALVAPTDATALILGETGTGKELIARAIHRISPRRNLPFVSLNCAAIPTGLLESELFGYERGAFTGALGQKIGRFEMANHGTLFLDEVGDIPLDLQPKLLRALQEKSFERLGGTRTIPIDVRLVAATNRNLTQMMGDKLFRPDLYYRLKVFPVNTPPLRDHIEDIPILVRHFTKKYANKMGRTIDKIPAETMKALVSWTWPGNVRELENFIERSVILSRGPILSAPVSELREDCPKTVGPADTLEEVQREHILRVFRESDGVISAAAARLGMPRTTLNAMMTKLGISRGDL